MDTFAIMSARKVVPAGDGDGDGGAADASLASLLHVLRSRLQSKVEGGGGDTFGGGSGDCVYRPEAEAGAPSTNDLLSSIVGSDPTLQASIQRHVRASAHSARVDALRRRRRELRVLRVAHEAARDQQKRAVEREAAKVGVVVERQRLAFGRYAHQQESAATQRLQVGQWGYCRDAFMRAAELMRLCALAGCRCCSLSAWPR